MEAGKRTKKKSIISLCIAVILLAIGITTYFFSNNKTNTNFIIGETINVTEPLEYLVKGENDEYYLIKANADIKFQVTTEDETVQYKIIDEDGNEIETTLSQYDGYYEIANTNNYEAGKTYTITLENSKFVDEKLKDIAKLNFTIVRANANTQILNDNVKKVNAKTVTNIEENENNFTLTSTKEYQKDDIIYYKNENDIKAFKVDIVTKNGDNYTITTTTPELEEIYKELDIYGEFTPKITNFIPNEELEEYVKVAVIESNILEDIIDSLGTTVYASSEELIQVEIQPQNDGSVKAIISINLVGNDNSFIDLKNMKNHEITFEIEMTLKLKTFTEINFFKTDVGANVDMEITKSLSIKPTEEYWEKFNEEEEKNDIESIENAKEILKRLKEDTAEGEQHLGEGLIPTPIPGITLNIGLQLVENLKIAFQLEASETTTIETNFGYKDGKKQVNKVGFYWNSDVNITDKSFTALGKAELRIGLMPIVEINFIEAIKVGAGIIVGGYGEGQINYSIFTEGEEDKIDGKLNFGIFVEGKMYGRAIGINRQEFTIYENKFELASINRDILEEKRIEEEKKAEEERKAKEEAEKKELEEALIRFAGTYEPEVSSVEQYGAKTLTLNKDGSLTGNKTLNYGNLNGLNKKPISIKKENDGSYRCELGEIDGYINCWYVITPGTNKVTLSYVEAGGGALGLLYYKK